MSDCGSHQTDLTEANVDEFKTEAKELHQVQTSLKELRNQVKILNNREKELKQRVSGFMNVNDLDVCNLPDGHKFVCKTSRVLAGGPSWNTKDSLIQSIRDFLENNSGNPEYRTADNQAKAEQIVQFSMDRREYTEKITLTKRKA